MSTPPTDSRDERAPAWHTNDVLRASALVIGLYLLLRLIWFAHPLFLVAFLGVLFGLAVSAGVDRLGRFGVPRGLGSGLIVISVLGLLVGFGALMAPTLREQGVELRRRLPEAIERAQNWVDQHRNGLVGIVVGSLATDVRQDSALGAPANPNAKDSSRAPVPQAVVPPANAADSSTATGALRAKLSGRFSRFTKYLFPFLSSTVEVAAGLVLIIFLSIYIAADSEGYRRGILRLFPHRARTRASDVLSAMAGVLRKWLVTQLIAMGVMAVVTTAALLALGVKAAFALGLLAGLFQFIPTMGPIISSLPAIAMGFLDSPEKALYVAIAYVGLHFLESHLLIPLLMKGGVDLPPPLTILTQALMAMLFGFLGLMCATPLLAATMVLVRKLYVEDVVGDPPTEPWETQAASAPT